MRRFREYDESAEADWKILEFTSSPSNRDGLALRAAADSLLNRPEENKILIVLSDGRPNDVVLNRPNVKNPAVYTGEYAVKQKCAAFVPRGFLYWVSLPEKSRIYPRSGEFLEKILPISGRYLHLPMW